MNEPSKAVKVAAVVLGFLIASSMGLLAIMVRPPIDAPAWMANPQALWGWLIGVATAYAIPKIGAYLDGRYYSQEDGANAE